MSSRPKRDPIVQHYIRAYGLHAVIVAFLPGRPAIIASGSNVAARLRALKHVHGRPVRLEACWWCPSAGAAKRLLDDFATLSLSPEDAVRRVPIAAIRLSVQIVSDHVVAARAKAAVAAIDGKIKAMNGRGELKTLNEEYRRQRLRRQKLGLGMMSYSAYLGRYRLRMIYQVAAEARARGGRDHERSRTSIV